MVDNGFFKIELNSHRYALIAINGKIKENWISSDKRITNLRDAIKWAKKNNATITKLWNARQIGKSSISLIECEPELINLW